MEENTISGTGRKKPKRGDRIEVTIDSMSFGGPGVGRTPAGMVIFVAGAVPGDRVIAVVTKRKKQYIEARVVEILDPSPDRIEPRCEHFGLCGGCKWQNYPYELQLKTKQQQVFDHLERIAGIPNPPVEDIIRMEHPWEYRNKMEYTFSRFKDGELKLGLHRPGAFNRIINIDNCHIQDKICNEIKNTVRQFCRERGISHHDVRRHEGELRNLVLRPSRNGIMACLVTHTHDFKEHADDFTALINEKFPEVKSLLWYVNKLLSGVAISGEEHVLSGDSYVIENVSGFELKVSALSFLQTNTTQCEQLYAYVNEYAALDGEGLVFDLYTGMAPIAMLLSRGAKKVIGIESNSQAVADGIVNLKNNNIDNVELMDGEVEGILPELCTGQAPDIIVADPPRAGIHKKALAAIATSKPGRIIYVSCNPSTLARDAAILAESGYQLSRVQPVDMFPHTAHIECVARFDLIS